MAREQLAAVDALIYHRSSIDPSEDYIEGTTTLDRIRDMFPKKGETEAESTIRMLIDGVGFQQYLDGLVDATPTKLIRLRCSTKLLATN